MRSSVIKSAALITFIALSLSAPLHAQAETTTTPEEKKASSLEDLLNNVSRYVTEEATHNTERERAFLAEKNNQKALLNQAEKDLDQEQNTAERLKKAFDENEQALTEKAEELRLRVGNLGEMFGVVRQVSDDLNGLLKNSITTAEKSERSADLDKLAAAKELPDIAELNALWYTLQEEMTLGGQVSRFSTDIIDEDGKDVQRDVIRVGTFNAIDATTGGYLRFDSETGRLTAMGRQPSESSLLGDFIDSDAYAEPIAIDPSRGALLGLVITNPDLIGRIKQGALVGYIIIVLAVAGLLIAVWRLVVLLGIRKRVENQMQQPETPSEDNPLGRVLAAAHALDINDPEFSKQEVLELKIDEAILKEVPELEKAQSMIKLFAGIAPLLGLLGTVTGMIATFQAITNFGTGDPKLMASGISQALITTVLGLVAAIPLLLSHNLVSGQSRRLVQILDEQATGFIAQTMEKQSERRDV